LLLPFDADGAGIRSQTLWRRACFTGLGLLPSEGIS
jgi:hypothetical protein